MKLVRVDDKVCHMYVAPLTRLSQHNKAVAWAAITDGSQSKLYNWLHEPDTLPPQHHWVWPGLAWLGSEVKQAMYTAQVVHAKEKHSGRVCPTQHSAECLTC